jgi:hypothetical protein
MVMIMVQGLETIASIRNKSSSYIVMNSYDMIPVNIPDVKIFRNICNSWELL